MNRNQLYESMEHIDDRVLERSEKRKISWKRWRMGAVAAVLVAAVALGVALQPTVRVGQNSGYTTGDAAEPMAVKATALRVAQYPNMAPYPDESQYEMGGDKADAGPEASGVPGSGESGAQETFDAEAYSKAHDAWNTPRRRRSPVPRFPRRPSTPRRIPKPTMPGGSPSRPRGGTRATPRGWRVSGRGAPPCF